SARDAAAYRRGLREFSEIREPLGRYRFNPIGHVPPLDELLGDQPKWLRRIAMSAWDVVRREYEDPHVQAYMLWQAFQTAHGVDTYDPGISILAQYYATTEPPQLVASGGTQTAVSAGVVGWPEDVLRAGRDVREGRLLHARWLLIATPTLVDPSRAPAGGHT